jgi:ATP-dependent DNA helicase RecQ
VPHLPGSGIIYTLTVADSNRVAQWLKQHSIRAEAYNADVSDRAELEQALLNNQLKALVATVALGMGFDKPDLGFVIHFQRPGSVVHYYQQVGRAGRAMDEAYGILLSGREDDEVQDYFIETAFPDMTDMRQVVRTLEGSEGLTIYAILDRVNLTYSAVEKILKLLEVDGVISSEKPKRGATVYFRTANPWTPDVARAEAVTQQRRKEQAEMQAYVTHTGCLMEFLARALDDPQAAACGKCANCRGEGLPISVAHDLVTQAIEFLKHAELEIEPRKRWPIGLFDKTAIAVEYQAETGRALCAYGDAGWGQLVREGKYRHGHFDDALVQAAAELIRGRWRPDPAPVWITAIPSRRHPRLVYDFAARLAQALRLPFIAVLERTQDVVEQKNMENSIRQARNVLNSLAVCQKPVSAPVLLIDDIVDSRWTFTAAAYLLRSHDSGLVYPFALASAARRDSST